MVTLNTFCSIFHTSDFHCNDRSS